MERTRDNKWFTRIIIMSVILGLIALGIALYFIMATDNNNENEHVAHGLPAPTNVKVEGNVLQWDSVSGSEGYRVYLGDNNDFYSSTSTNKLIVNDMNDGRNYKFAVAAVDENGVSSEHLSEHVDVRFSGNDDVIAVGVDTPQPDINAAGTYLEWAPIPNAVAYSISVNGQDQSQTVSPNFRVNELFDGIHQLRVRALGDGYNYAHSQWSTPVYFYQTGQTLEAPYAQLNTSTASWSAVSGATSYEVSDNGSISQKSQLTLPLSDLSVGTHNIQVRAINGTSNSDWSNTITHTVAGSSGGGDNSGGNNNTTSLSAPSILFKGAEVEWSPITGATSYDISVDDVITNQTQVGFPFSGLGNTPGVKKVYVRARNSSGTSGWSNLLRPTVNLMSPDVTLADNTLSWAAIQGAYSGYQVCIDGSLENYQSTTTFNTASLANGVHMLTVRAYTTSPMTLVSEWSSPIGLTVGTASDTLSAPFIGLMEEGSIGNNMWVRARAIRWDAVSGATGYDVSIDGTNVVTNNPFPIYNANDLAAGTHTVKVRSNNGATTSAWSNEITFDPSKAMDSVTVDGSTTANNLPAPTLGFGGRTCSWNSVSGGVAYELQVNGTNFITAATSYTLPNSLANGAYAIRVRALNNSDKLSQWSNVLYLFL